MHLREITLFKFDQSLFFPASFAKEMKYFFKNMLLHEFTKLFLKKIHNCIERGLEAEAIERHAAGYAEQRVEAHVQSGGQKQEAAGEHQRADGEERVEQRCQHAARHRKAANAPEHVIPRADQRAAYEHRQKHVGLPVCVKQHESA